MGKKQKKAAKAVKAGTVARLPKKKCCVATTRCHRCPLRMLKEGTLPEGYTVHKRRLVTTAERDAKKTKKKLAA